MFNLNCYQHNNIIYFTNLGRDILPPENEEEVRTAGQWFSPRHLPRNTEVSFKTPNIDMVRYMPNIDMVRYMREYLIENKYLDEDFPEWKLVIMYYLHTWKGDDFSWLLDDEKANEVREALLIETKEGVDDYTNVAIEVMEILTIHRNHNRINEWIVSGDYKDKRRFPLSYITKTNSLYWLGVDAEEFDTICYIGKPFMFVNELPPKPYLFNVKNMSHDELCAEFVGKDKFDFYRECTRSFVADNLIYRIRTIDSKMLSGIDPKFWDGDFYTKSLIKAGAKLENLMPSRYLKGLTNKEKHSLLVQLLESEEEWGNHIRDNTVGCGPLKVDHYLKALGVDERYKEAFFYCDSAVSFKWATRNVKKLIGYRDVTVPGGRTARVYNHRVLSHLKDEHFTKGEFTGWRKLNRIAREAMDRELELQLKVNRNLPEFPITISDSRIEQITTSFGLKVEGDNMEHCVASYVGSCIAGDSYIFHIDDGSLMGATVELTPSRHSGKYDIVQCLTADNIEAPEAEKIIREVMKRMDILGK